MKTCTICKVSKPLSEFGVHSRRPDGLRGNCKSCGLKPPRIFDCLRCGGRFEHAKAGGLPNLCPSCETTHLNCHGCNQVLPRSSFFNSVTSRTGKTYKCRACVAEYQSGERARNKKAAFVRQRYGIDLETYEAHMAAPDGVCPCCGKTGRKKMCLDHDHATGAIRGVICSACNSGIGLLGDDLAGLHRAIAYLERVT